jgi:hypothetical protein
MAGIRFFGTLPWHLRRGLTLAEAKAGLATRLEHREDLLLERIRHDVFDHPGSVYHRLFRQSGCEFADVERSVRSNGADAAMKELLRAGVFLTVDEFKGRKAVVRGSLRIETAPENLRSPRAAYHLPASSGGSRSSGTRVLIDFRFVRACAANYLLCLDAWGGRDWIKADWETVGAGARFRLIKFAMFGRPPQAWFTQIDPTDPSLPGIFRWNTRALHWSSALSGRPLPPPVSAPLNDPSPVAQWLVKVLGTGAIPVMFTFPGSALRLCLAAANKGMELAGTRFVLAGEPITAARVATVRSSGCVAIPRYGSIECGAIGYGCPQGEYPDEVHLLQDMHVLISAEKYGAALGLPPEALFVTALHRNSPFLMLNVSMGDQAEIGRRDCGCAWQRLGLTTSLRNIRSFEKLTGGGVTFLGTEVIEILEQVLPAEFGGSPTDYQLAEEESATGEPLLALSIHPSIGPVNEPRVKEVFLGRLADSSAAARVMVQMWRDSGSFAVRRRFPQVSRAGKILHLHVNKTSASHPTNPAER